MSRDKVLQHTTFVGTTQAPTEQLNLAAQGLLGQPAHVGHCMDRVHREQGITVLLTISRVPWGSILLILPVTMKR